MLMVDRIFKEPKRRDTSDLGFFFSFLFFFFFRGVVLGVNKIIYIN